MKLPILLSLTPQEKIRLSERCIYISQVTQFSPEPCWSTKAHGNGNQQVQEILEIELRFAQSAQGAVGNERDKKNKEIWMVSSMLKQ